MTYEEDLQILSNLPGQPVPLPSEGALEHIGNAQQLALDLQRSIFRALSKAIVLPSEPEQGPAIERELRTAYETVCALKRRLGWARDKVER